MIENCIDCGNPLGEGALAGHGDTCLDCLERERLAGTGIMTEQDLIEALADKEHASWARWMRYLFSRCEFLPDGRVVIPAELMGRWARQSTTPYAHLSETEKQSDRNEVAHILPIIQEYAKK